MAEQVSNDKEGEDSKEVEKDESGNIHIKNSYIYNGYNAAI